MGIRPWAMLLALWLAPGVATAQGTTGFEISFSNPGARAMGFGGAFIGLADDATAAFANPAGLVQLNEPEVSIEGRTWSYDTPFTRGGRASGRPTSLGIDTTEGLRIGVSSEDASGLSFLSFVHPFERWSIAVYRHQLANFESRFATNGLFAAPAPGAIARFPDALSASLLDHVSHGVSVAFRASETLALGAGISAVEGSVTIVEETFLPDDETPQALFAPNSYLPARSIGTTEIRAEETDWTLLAGFLWRLSRRVSLGGVVREGPSFRTDAIARAGPAFDPQVPPGSELRFSARLDTPDVFGLGLAARLRGDTLTLAFDWVRVEYSDLLEGFDPQIFDDLARVDDGDEFHAGVEIAFLRSTPIIALRAGAWLDPDHRLRATADTTDPFRPSLLPGGDDEIHVAAGLGLVFERLQLDFGVDLSELVDTASISMIVGF